MAPAASTAVERDPGSVARLICPSLKPRCSRTSPSHPNCAFRATRDRRGRTGQPAPTQIAPAMPFGPIRLSCTRRELVFDDDVSGFFESVPSRRQAFFFHQDEIRLVAGQGEYGDARPGKWGGQ